MSSHTQSKVHAHSEEEGMCVSKEQLYSSYTANTEMLVYMHTSGVCVVVKELLYVYT